jgi:hypothetical protein
MAATFPSGIDPFIFFDTLPLNSTDTSQTNLDQHANTFNVADFTAAVPAGTARLFVTFVVFAYPNAANSATTSPKAPIIEILKQGVSFDGPGLALHLTPDGTDALDLGAGRAINYSYKGLGGGVFQIVFTPDNVPLDSIAWKIRFTINDGLTSSQAQIGLTFVVDGADTRGPWIAVPGQLNLPPTGPKPIDFAAALAGVTLAGPVIPPTGAPLMGGTTFRALLPIGNYGTGPLTLTAVTLAGAPGHLSARLTATPLAIPPGSINAEAVEVSYAAPAAGESREPSAAAIFALASDDPLAAKGGATAHFNTLSLFAEITIKLFAPALDRDWVGGTANPQVSVGSGANIFIARGNMKLDLPHLFRIRKFSASVKINANVEGFSTLFVSLQRMALDGTNPQHVVADLGIPFALGMAEVAGFPSPESELIDNHLFQYFVNAVYAVRNAHPTTTIVPTKAVVWQSFEVEFSSG